MRIKPPPQPQDNPHAEAAGGRAHFLQVILSQRSQMEALVSRRVGCRATAADRAVQAAIGGFERKQPGHEVAHPRLVMRREAFAHEVFHRPAAGLIDLEQAKAACRGLHARGGAGRVVEPWEVHVCPGPLMRTGPDPDHAGLSAA